MTFKNKLPARPRSRVVLVGTVSAVKMLSLNDSVMRTERRKDGRKEEAICATQTKQGRAGGRGSVL